MRRIIATLSTIAVAATAFPDPALANGLSTHVWISLRARELLSPGPLRDFIGAPDLEDALVSGTIFPDGGYGVGNDYGERAHWEPFQLEYLAWLTERHPAPWGEDARPFVAFMFGLASHGMADQVFDSLYMERARQHDADSDWATLSMDEATDVSFVSAVGSQPVPRRFVPADELIEVFARVGHTVDAQTLNRGQSHAGLAVAIVGMLAEDPDAVATYSAQFPWATSHLQDDSMPGAPEHEARLVALYWQHIWDRLRGTIDDSNFVIATVPESGATGHSTLHERAESRISVVFSRRLLRKDVGEGSVQVVDSAGNAVAMSLRLFYGDDSHVLHLIPRSDLKANEDFAVTVQPGLTSAGGELLEAPFVFRVSTRPSPDPGVVKAEGCTSATGKPTWLLAIFLGLALLRRRAR